MRSIIWLRHLPTPEGPQGRKAQVAQSWYNFAQAPCVCPPVAARLTDHLQDIAGIVNLIDQQAECEMSIKTFSLVAGVVFAVVALVQILRIVMAWEVVIGGWAAPMWFSWIAVVVAGFLSFTGLRFAARAG